MGCLFSDRYASVVRISEFIGIDRDQFREHPVFGRAVKMFDQVLKE